jgi:hypothetical protein
LAKPIFDQNTISRPSLVADILKRVPRLGLPLYFFTAVAMTFALTGFYEHYTSLAAVDTGSTWLQAMFPSAATTTPILLKILTNPFEYSCQVLPPSWTISTELVGSFLTYLLAASMHSSTFAPYIALSAFLMAPGYLKLFVCGVFYAWADSEGLDFSMQVSNLGWLIIWCVVVVYFGSYPWYVESSVLAQIAPIYKPAIMLNQLLVNVGCAGGITSAAAIVFFVGLKRLSRSSIWSRKIAQIGKYTYTVYLAHALVLAILIAPSFAYLIKLNVPFKVTLWICYIGYVFAIALSAVLLTDIIDGKSIQFSKHLKRLYLKSTET